jgi:hypothetical protein
VLLELQAAVGARAFDERQGRAARGARIAAEVHLAGAFAIEQCAPVTAHDLGNAGKLVLLDQEVRPRPSTFAGAGRATDEGRNAGGEAAIAQRLHLADRARHRGDERQTVE